MKKAPSGAFLLPAKKSDKNLRTPENLVYYIYIRDEEEKSSRYIRRIRRRKNSFLCLNAAAVCSGICVFPDKEFGIL